MANTPSHPGWLAAAWPLLLPAVAAADPAVLLKRNGPSANRVDVAYVAEGYTAQELPAFGATVDRAVLYKDTAEIAQPYKRYRRFFNYYRIDLPSLQSGIDEPDRGIYRNTALDAYGQARKGLVDIGKAKAAVAGSMPPGDTADWIFAVLNTGGYYNSGGAVCVFSHPNYGEIALHEAGHSFHGLADEYGGPGTYAGTEPKELNVTQDPAAAKWAHWKGYQQPLVGPIGAFPGARYYDQGLYRPSSNSKMRLTGETQPQAFSMPAMEKIIQDIYARVRPLDSWRDNRTTLLDPESLWVRTVDPSVLWVDWWVDGQLVRRNGGETLKLSQLPLSQGLHRVKAQAYDEVILHAHSDNARPHPLDWIRKGMDRLKQEVEWNVQVSRINSGMAVLPPPRSGFPGPKGNGALSFHLPRAGTFRLALHSTDGTLLRIVGGEGREGWQTLDRPAGLHGIPVFLNLEASGLPGARGTPPLPQHPAR